MFAKTEALPSLESPREATTGTRWKDSAAILEGPAPCGCDASAWEERRSIHCQEEEVEEEGGGGEGFTSMLDDGKYAQLQFGH